MTILAAIGGEHERDRVVEVGHDLANAYGDDLVVLHVMPEEQFEELQGNGEIISPVTVPGTEDGSGFTYVSSDPSSSSPPEYDLEMATSDAADVARECVERTLSGERSGVSPNGRVGDPATEIVNEADRIDARYVVVGGRHRSPVGKAVFGSVSQSVILDSDRPVVAITRGE